MSETLKDTPAFNRLADYFGAENPDPQRDWDRDPAGTFRNGNRGGPGNPFARRVAKLRQVMLEECAEEDLRGMTRAMIDLAKGGDKAAAKLILQYTLGKPGKMVDPDRIDEDELNVLKGMALPAPVFDAMLKATPADNACRMLQLLWPALMKATGAQLAEQIEKDRQMRADIEEDDKEYEALPAEEKLKWYAAGQLTPPPELVEQAAQEKAAREASVRSEEKPAPSPNGVSRGDKFIRLSERAAKGENVAARPSPNGVLARDVEPGSQFEQVNKLVPTAGKALRDGK
ncbi:MAG: hypothetical protein K2X38_20355 [Gemmataceae bacterium]|nr:hypothetical protein [Gemmataceae bacterium]